MASGPERVQAALHEVGIDVNVIRLSESTRTATEAAQAMGCDVGAIAKSLLFLADGEPLLVICGGDKRVDTSRVAELVGAKSLKMAPAEEVKRITGYAIGGVPPLGHAVTSQEAHGRKASSLANHLRGSGCARCPLPYRARCAVGQERGDTGERSGCRRKRRGLKQSR